MNVSPESRPIPTVSEPESELDRRIAAIWIGLIVLFALLLAAHFGPDIVSFLETMASLA
jgi:hypothetical protein